MTSTNNDKALCGVCGQPMPDVSQWMDYGKKYGYNTFFKERIRTQAREEVIAEKEELVDALEDMYMQYCNRGHNFMSAGEQAEIVLQKYSKLISFGGGGVPTWTPLTDSAKHRNEDHEN